MKQKILQPELSYKINGLLFKTHNDLGRFCRERQYCDYLENLLKESGLKYKREYQTKNINNDSPKGNIVDFLVEDKIIIEAKAKQIVTKEDYVQLQRYLQSANLELGLLVNFRSSYLKAKRVLNSKHSDYSDDICRLGSRGGFTLIELLIVIGITLALAVASVPIYGNLQVSSQVNNNTDLLIQTVRTARQNSISRLNASSYGVKFETDNYILYQGSSYLSREASYDRIIDLGSTLTLTTNLTGDEINFSKSLGEPSTTGTITLTHDNGNIKTIVINALGVME